MKRHMDIDNEKTKTAGLNKIAKLDQLSIPAEGQTEPQVQYLLQLCRRRQQKKVKKQFKEHTIDRTFVSAAPTIRVLKKYGRFNRWAKEQGFLKYPVPSDQDRFEVFDITSGGVFCELSPMFLGPVVDEFGDVIGANIEDCWQGLKVWNFHLNGGVLDAKDKRLWRNGTKQFNAQSDDWIDGWQQWSKTIRFSGEAKRRRATIDADTHPLFTFYRNQRLEYVRARKLTYVRWYAKLVKQTKAFRYLQDRFNAGISLMFLDPDGQARDKDWEPCSPQNLQRWIDDSKVIFCHGFVLACCLQGIDVWSDEHLSNGTHADDNNNNNNNN